MTRYVSAIALATLIWSAVWSIAESPIPSPAVITAGTIAGSTLLTLGFLRLFVGPWVISTPWLPVTLGTLGLLVLLFDFDTSSVAGILLVGFGVLFLLVVEGAYELHLIRARESLK